MKRIFCVLLMLLVVAALPVCVCARTYTVSETDLTISIDDSYWYVFTRDNIMGNPELDELGVTYEYMQGVFEENGAYMDAVLYYGDGEFLELFVRKRSSDAGVANLSNYEDEDVLDLAKELANKVGAENYSVYKNQYKFAKQEYVDAKYGYYIYEFVTVVNKEIYTFTFQSTSPFTQEEYEEMDSIVDSARFDVDPSIKEKKDSFFRTVAGKAVIGGVTGGLAGGVIVLLNKKKKGTKKEQSSLDPME